MDMDMDMDMDIIGSRCKELTCIPSLEICSMRIVSCNESKS